MAGGAAEEHRVHAKRTVVLDARIHLLPSAAPGAVQRGEEASRGAITARGLLTARHYRGRRLTLCHLREAICRFTECSVSLCCRTSRAKRGCGHHPGGCPQPFFGDSFEDLSKKRADVDMWTGVSLLIIERRGVHSSWGALGGAGPCKDSRRGTLLTPPPP